MIIVLFFILSYLNATTIYYNLFADDNITEVYINNVQQTFNGNAFDFTQGTFTATEGDWIKFKLKNEYLSGGILGNLTIDKNVFVVNMFHTIFWYVQEYPSSSYAYDSSCTGHCMLGNEQIGVFTYIFHYPLIRYLKPGERYEQRLSELYLSYDFYKITLVSHKNGGAYYVDDVNITDSISQSIESSKSFVFVPGQYSFIEIIVVSGLVGSNIKGGQNMIFVISDKLNREGFDCRYNNSYSNSEPYCFCSDNYYPLSNDDGNCYNTITSPYNYYLDDEQKVFKECSSNCYTCFGGGTAQDNQCLSCNTQYYLVEDYPHNCYQYSEVLQFPNSNYFLDNDGVLKHCAKKWYPPLGGGINHCVDECPDDFPLEIVSSRQCVSSCPSGLFVYRTECYSICPSGYKNIGSTCIEDKLLSSPVDSFVTSDQDVDTLVGKMEKNIGEYAKSIKGNIKGNGYYIQLYQLGSDALDNNEISSIDIGKCEDVLRAKYNIPLNESLMILKIDKKQPNSLVNKVEFKVYSQSGEELNVWYCSSVDIIIDYVLSDTSGINFDKGRELSTLGVDMYNREDTFYNDKCFPYSSEEGDMILADRVEQFYIKVDFCKEGCLYDGVDYEANKVRCNCNDNHEQKEFIEKNKTESFLFSLYKETNLEIVKCYKGFFTKDIFNNNKGLYITLSLFLIQLVLSIVFFIKGVNSILKEIESASKSSAPKKKKRMSIVNNKTLNTSDSSSSIILQSTKRNIEEHTSSLENEELNALPYDPALEYDHRSFLKLFFIVFISKLDLINIFFYLNPLELFPICLSSYIFSFSLDITFNAILFSDDIISEKYNNGGKMNKYSSLGLSIISSVISSVISSMIAKLISYSLIVEKLINEKNFNINFWKKMNRYMKMVKVRLVSFCIIELVVTFFCVFFNGLFCKIYKGSQDNWIADFIIGIGTSMVYTIGISLFITITRFIGLKCKCHYIYNISLYCNLILN